MKFTKMQGLGNDYVYINNIEENIKDAKKLAQFVSDRHFGIGSDGLILIGKSAIADFKMTIYNVDGSEAEMCGNGIRCVGKYVYDKGLTKKNKLTIETKAGLKKLDLNIKDGKVVSVKVDMGEPILEASLIPVLTDISPVQNLVVKELDKEFKISCVSMGNPHAVIVVDDVKNFAVSKYGALLEVNKLFPKRVNVEFVEIVDKDHIKMRVWERGVGETMACGTGSCATAVACILNGLCNRAVEIELLGGKLQIEWNEEDNHVYMTGPAATVYEGILEGEDF